MHLNLRLLQLAAVVVCLAGFANSAHAQGNSLFGNSGPIGGRNGVGTATTGSTIGTMTSSSFPTTQFGNAAGGAGANGAGMGMAGQQGLGANGQQGSIVGQRNTRFVGNAQATQTTPGQNGLNGQTNRQGQNRNNTTRRTGQNPNQTNQVGGTAGNQQQKTVRPRMQVAFDHPVPSAEKTQATLTTRFEKLANKTQFKDIEIEVDGSRVILRGEVAKAQDSKLATILARLEPGVRTVQNELTVTESAAPAITE